MECGQARELLSAVLDGEASAEDSRRVAEHLAGCEGCRATEGRMRALDVAVQRTETGVSPEFRDRLFSRMEAEELLPRRRSLFAFSLRWAALPLAAAAALALFLLTSRETAKGPAVPAQGPQVASTRQEPAPSPGAAPPAAPAPVPEAAGTPANGREVAAAAELSEEEREIVAYLEILEDPDAFEEAGGIDEMELFLPAGGRRG